MTIGNVRSRLVGSGRTWVPGHIITNGNVVPYVPTGTPLNFDISTSYGKRKREVKSKRSTDEGPAYSDDFTVDGLTANDLQFFVAEDHKPRAGIIGMGYLTQKAIDGRGGNWTGFFETLILQNKIKTPEFSFFHGRGGVKTNMKLGGRDSTKYTGDFSTTPVVKMGDGWQVQLDGVSVNGQAVKGFAPGESKSEPKIMIFDSKLTCK